MKVFAVSFCGRPDNYSIIDKYVSRSAQPEREDLSWLKEQGVTDVFNFRTMGVANIDFNEEQEVKNLGMTYHSLPSYTSKPSEENIYRFLKEVNEVKERGGKAHIHCYAGADRTGMYAFVYKMLNNIGSLHENEAEWVEKGLHRGLYPELMSWTEKFVKKAMRK